MLETEMRRCLFSKAKRADTSFPVKPASISMVVHALVCAVFFVSGRLYAASSSPSSGDAAREAQWVLAAAEFTLIDVPETYASYAQLVPKLVLNRLNAAQIRLVGVDEKRNRALQVLLNERMERVSERREALFKKNSLFFSTETDEGKNEARRTYDELIEEKQRAVDEIDAEIEGKIFNKNGEGETENVPVVFWKGGASLYAPKEGVPLAESLYDDGVSGLITGEIRDIGGYMYVSVEIDTGYGAVATSAVSHTAHYDDLNDVVFHLAVSLVPQIANRRPVSLYVSVQPEEAFVFVDGFLVQNRERPVVVFAGAHTIEASASGFASSIRTADFIDDDEFEVSISLNPLKKISVAFNTDNFPASLFLQTQYFGTTPQEVSLPFSPAVGELVHDDVQTFFVFNPDADEFPEGAVLSTDLVPDKKNTERRIERQRKVLYWSLGLLYLALPAAFLIRGEADARSNAYNSGRLEATQENVDNINSWILAGNITTGICIGLGVNLVFQLVRYMLAVEQVTPQEPELRWK